MSSRVATRSSSRANGSASSSSKKQVKKSTTNKKDNKKGSASHGRSAVGNGNVSPGDSDANDEERPDSPSSTSSEGRPKESLKPTKQSSGQQQHTTVAAANAPDFNSLVAVMAAAMNGAATANAIRQPSSSPTRRVEVRLRDISAYKGTAGEALDSWIAQLTLHYDNYVVEQGASESQFVASAATTLADAAVVWWQSVDPTKRPKSWSGMQTALKAQFQPIDSTETARSELWELKQSPQQSVVEYVSAFRRLLARAGKELASPSIQTLLTERFIAGLRSADIKRDLKKGKVKVLDTAIEMASTLDGCEGSSNSVNTAAVAIEAASMRAQLAALTAEMQSWKKKAGNDFSSSSSSNGYDSRRDRGANKGSFNASANRIPGLTGEMAKHRRENGLCLYCGHKDHIVRDCPDRVNKKAPTLN